MTPEEALYRERDRGRRLQTDIVEMSVEIRELKEQLSRSKTLASLLVLRTHGMNETIKHLKKHWQPCPGDEHLKSDMQSFVDDHIRKAEQDPEIVEKTRQDVENYVRPPKNKPMTNKP